MERNYKVIYGFVLSETFETNLDKRWRNRARRTLESTLGIIKHLEKYPKDKQAKQKLYQRYGRLCFYFNECAII